MALYDLVRVRVTSTGTSGPLQLGPAVGGGRTLLAAAVPDGKQVSYGITQGAFNEACRGTFDAANNRLTRNFVASTTGSPIDLNGQAVLEITPLAADFAEAIDAPIRIDASLASTWILSHSLGRIPTVHVFLASGEEVLTDIARTASQITVTFPSPQQGYVLIF